MKICMISLGCDKNLVDSEMMLGFLHRGDVSFTGQVEEADTVIVNTCCFILDAKKESIRTVLDMAERKKKKQIRALIVAGCLAQRYRDEILNEIPEVDAVVGTSDYDAIGKVLKKVEKGERTAACSTDRLPRMSRKRTFSSAGYFGYLKIAEGCDKHCTYCIIPSLRGKYRSYPMEDLVRQASAMVSSGVKELILVAQETTVYGTDLYGKKSLPALLKKLCRIKDLEWIRILYCYPEEITEELIQTIRKEKKVCRYLDIPVQHASDAILKRMGRRTTEKELEEIIGRIREVIPEMAIRTTLISGFPGETEKDHRILKSFVRRMKFDHLGVFPYSREEGTPAALFPDQVPQKIKKLRRADIMAIQQKISAAKMKKLKGKVLEVMVEGKLPRENVYTGRTYRDAPEVDGNVFFPAEGTLLSGSIVKVKITGSSEYDLTGEIV